MRKKILTLLLCCALVSGLVPTVNINAYAQEPEQTLLVYQDGEAVTEAALPVSQKITLQANVYPEDFAAQSYQWQIQVPGGVWVDIAGEVQKTINLTYGMVASLLDSDNAVQVRCKLIDDSVGAMLSNEVRVTVDNSQPLPELPLENGTVLREAEAVENPAPAQDKTPAVSDNDQTAPAPADNADSNTSAPSTEPQAPADSADTNVDADAPAASDDSQAAPAPADNAAAPAAAADAPAADADTQPAASADTPAGAPAPAPADAANAPADDLNNAKADLVSSPSDVMDTLPTPVDALDQIKSTLQDAAATLADETAETETFNIIINYVFENGAQAANPWTANIAKGSDYKQTITSPTVLGYAPDQATVEVVIENIQKDETYTVTYKPAEVNLTVKHYQQNIDDDKYTLADTETEKGYTASEVGEALSKEYDGFYALLYDTKTEIAADGSTVVEIYYDRYYYLMNFDLDGGYGVEPIYARYGTPISVDTNLLKKTGYTFENWDKELPSTMPNENSTYKAVWKPVDAAKVTIVVWGENPNDEDYSYYKNGEIMAKPGEKLTLDDLQGKLICGKEEHAHSEECRLNCQHSTHDLTCYGLDADAQAVTPDSEAIKYFAQLQGGVQDGYIYYFDDNGYNGTGDNYYLRLNGLYYKYSGRPNSNMGSQVGNRVYCTEGGVHARDYFYKYQVKITCPHTHTDSCYSCGLEEHTHTSACYYNGSFMDNSNLWRLVSSDEITVAADGSSIINVYYDREEFTLHFRRANSNTDNYGTIKDKWGASITQQFEAKSTAAGSSSWSEKQNADGPWTSYLDVMPTENRIYYAYQTYGTETAKYYVEDLNGQDKLYYTSTASGSGLLVSKEEFITIDGFTFDADRSAKENAYFNGAKFYYTRNSYTLTFRSDNKDVRVETEKFEAPLEKYSGYTPEYPKSLEEGAYEFAGWYTTAGCYPGSEFKFGTMPASNLILFAKWSPVQHTVKTWLTDEQKTPVNVGESGSNEQKVPHGSNAVAPETPKNGNYTFIGWFYKDDNGVEKAFDFSMPVNRDLDLYAKWSSNTLVTYTIHYQLANGTTIAPDTTGSALADTTKTFDAKAGSELNAGYQTGYFPETNSHSIKMDINGNNEFTFIYVPKEKVKYTVRYLEKGTDAVLHNEKSGETSDAVITEKFEQVNGYAPDAYQKRLVLSANEEENVIIFWYVKDNVHAPVQVIHWIQNIEGDGYTEYQSSTDLNAEINEPYSAGMLDIAGFKFKEGKVDGVTTDLVDEKLTATVTEAGLVLSFYYDRIEYPYEFRFLEQGTDKVLAESVTGSARYQAQATQQAKNIPGYTLVSGKNQAINIAIEDPADVANKNVRTFYYQENEVNIAYVVVGPTGCGIVSRAAEKVKVISGTAQGSTPTANPGYRFVGWFMDEPCLIPVESIITGAVDSATNKMTPQKRPSDNCHFAATYYAKFERALADLTITKSGWDSIDENQSFIFHIKGTDKNTEQIDMDVVIHGSGSVKIKDLPVGTYTVTEKTAWSWRYTPDQASKSVDLTTDKELPFSNNRPENKWLNGNAFYDNRWMNGSQDKKN